MLRINFTEEIIERGSNELRRVDSAIILGIYLRVVIIPIMPQL